MNNRGTLSIDVILVLLGYAVGTVVFAYSNFLPRTEADKRAEYAIRERDQIRSDITEMKGDIKELLRRTNK